MEFSVSAVQSASGPILVPNSQMLFSDIPEDNDWDPADLVEAFNALPRYRYVPTDKIPNKWHFSLRQIPSHGMVIFLVNPYCQFIHIKPLPPYSRELQETSGISDPNDLMNLITACLLMKAFVENFDDDSMPPVGRPWSWAMTDASTASKVETALTNLGVNKPSCKVFVGSDNEKVLAEQVWNRFQGASEWGDGSGLLGASNLVRSLPSMAAQAREAESMSPRRNSRCIMI